jgi:hypothetical protein
MLDSNPLIAGGPEFDNIPEIVGLRNRLLRSVERGRIDVFLSEDDVDLFIGGFIEDLLTPYREKNGAEFLAEKTPANALSFGALLSIFPRARCVFCVRDPRAVVASMLEVGRRARDRGVATSVFTRNIFDAVLTVKAYNRAGFRAAHSSDRVHIVRYEDLVTDTDSTTQRLCQFLQIPWVPAMSAPGQQAHDNEALIDGIWFLDKAHMATPTASRLDAWRKSMSASQIALLTVAFAGDTELINLGYSVGHEGPKVLRSDQAARLGTTLFEEMSRLQRGLRTASAMIRGIVPDSLAPTTALATS